MSVKWANDQRSSEEQWSGRVDRITHFLRLKGKQFSFQYHPFLPSVYKTPLTNCILMAGRQVSKSTSLTALLCDAMSSNPYFAVNYITPLKEQTARFSTLYLKPMIEGSPVLKDVYLGPSTEQNVFRKSFSNGSVCNLQYAFLDAERVRGTPADWTLFDEVQDILWENIPVIKECMGFSDYKWETYAGTAKTYDNTIEKLWSSSTMREWVMRCDCGKDNIPTVPWVYKMIREKGFCCYSCGKLLNVSNGRWVVTNKDATRDGFHIPQLIVPKNVDPNSDAGWKKILQKQREYPAGKFANEVLGISFDTGGRLITLSEIREKCCKDWELTTTPPLNHGCSHFVIGVDWGISAQTSFTVAVAMGITPDGTVKVFYAKKFLGTDILDQINEIIKLANAYEARFICCDFGVGYTNNQILRQKYMSNRIMEFQYVRQKSFLHWDGKSNRYMLSRTASLNVLFFNMKRGALQLPKYDVAEPFIEDIMSVYEEVVDNQGGTVKVFLHTPDVPDDFVHAVNFGWVGLRRLVNDPILASEEGD